MSDWRIEERDGVRYLYKGLVEWMCDDLQRRTVMDYYASLARGRTLVGGLGLGLLTWACHKNEEVTVVTTIELDRSLAEFIYLPGTTLGDAWECAALPGLWDTVILDLWPDNAQPDEDLAERADAIRTANPGVTLIIHGYSALSDA